MAVFLVAHGAWSSGWAWKKMRPLMQARGHALFVPSLTGLGERAHLASAAVDLETHIRDVAAVLDCEDLRDVVLIGHSYGGMVATGVAERMHARLSRLVYLDAFVPQNGQSMFDLLAPQARENIRAQVSATGDGWRVAPNPLPPDTSAEDREWIRARRLPQPLLTMLQSVSLGGAASALPRTYIYCQRPNAADNFRQFKERAQREPGWRLHEIDSSHSPHVTAPELLMDLLEKIVRDG